MKWNPIKHFRRKAYHAGFDDAMKERPLNTPRFFRDDYLFGYDWAWAWRVPHWNQLPDWDWAAAKERQAIVKAKWFPEMAAD
jgi:hypothetical protein